jgi:hypothetical protein
MGTNNAVTSIEKLKTKNIATDFIFFILFLLLGTHSLQRQLKTWQEDILPKNLIFDLMLSKERHTCACLLDKPKPTRTSALPEPQ